jgi:hypothetical protein
VEISKWLSGTPNFTFDTLIDIQTVLDIELVNTKTTEQQKQQNNKSKQEACWRKMLLLSIHKLIRKKVWQNKGLQRC